MAEARICWTWARLLDRGLNRLLISRQPPLSDPTRTVCAPFTPWCMASLPLWELLLPRQFPHEPQRARDAACSGSSSEKPRHDAREAGLVITADWCPTKSGSLTRDHLVASSDI